MDYATLGYDNAGFIVHVTRGEKWLCDNTARQIRKAYKSVAENYAYKLMSKADKK